jgi:two-component system sensor histidine kinase UhpB
MENTEAIHKVRLTAPPAKQGVRDRWITSIINPAMNRVKRRPLFQKVVIANTMLIIAGAVMGTHVARRYFEYGEVSLLLVFAIGGLSLSILTNYMVVKVAFHPLDTVAETLRAVRYGHRGLRVPEIDDDPQIEELSRSLNSMLGSLEQQRRKGAASAIRAQEEERKRIARELHDETSQSLTGLVLGLKVAEELTPGDMPDLKERLLGIKDLAHATLSEVHTMAIRLRPSVLDDLGLSAALRSYVKEFSVNTGIHVDLRTVSLTERLPAKLETVLYRVVQEALTNVARHSGAKSCRVALERQDTKVRGLIADNGCGFDAQAALLSDENGRGLGLHGMQERVELVDGLLRFESQPGEGTTIHLEIPLESKEGVW